MRLRVAVPGILVCLLQLKAFPRSEPDSTADPKVYYGSVKDAQRPSEIVAREVFERISEYREIQEQGLTEKDPEYFILLQKANEKFLAAVKKMAEAQSRDVVVEKGTAKFEGEVSDLTQKTIECLEK